MTLCAISVSSQLALVATDELSYYWDGNVKYAPAGASRWIARLQAVRPRHLVGRLIPGLRLLEEPVHPTRGAQAMMWSVYSLETGLFTGERLTGPLAMVTEHLPAGFGLQEGDHDHLSRRRDPSGEVVDWVPPKPADTDMATFSWDEAGRRWIGRPTNAAIANDVRARRNALLTTCDWVLSRAMDLSEPVPPAWTAYRKALRDVPLQQGFPTAVDWPTPPV
jgi:hypothetical protein